MVKLLLYMGFIYVILKTYGLPLHIIRDLYFTFRSFATRLADMIQYRRATYNMNERYVSERERCPWTSAHWVLTGELGDTAVLRVQVS